MDKTSIQIWSAIMGGIASTHITKSEILQACLASTWAAILPCLRTWFVFHILKAFSLVLAPSQFFGLSLGDGH